MFEQTTTDLRRLSLAEFKRYHVIPNIQLLQMCSTATHQIYLQTRMWNKQKVSRLRLYKMRVLKYYVENKAQLETWK